VVLSDTRCTIVWDLMATCLL